MVIDSTYNKLVGLLDVNDARYRVIKHAVEGWTDIASALRSNALAQAAQSVVVRVSITKRKSNYLLVKYVRLNLRSPGSQFAMWS